MRTSLPAYIAATCLEGADRFDVQCPGIEAQILNPLFNTVPFEGKTEGHFGTFIKKLQSLHTELKRELSNDWADQQLLQAMGSWLKNVSDGLQYDFFKTFASQFCQFAGKDYFDQRPSTQKLKHLLFPPLFPGGKLAFYEKGPCWTFGLGEADQLTAVRAFLDAQLLTTETYIWLIKNNHDIAALCRKYFDISNTSGFPSITQKFEKLNSTIFGKKMFVLCAGVEKPARRSAAYVNQALDRHVNADLAKYCGCIFLNAPFFKGTEDYDQYTVSGEALFYHGMTILHELTHLVIDTQDYKNCYGRAKCFYLAEWESHNAESNADNFALFARDLKLLKSGKRLYYLK